MNLTFVYNVYDLDLCVCVAAFDPDLGAGVQQHLLQRAVWPRDAAQDAG